MKTIGEYKKLARERMKGSYGQGLGVLLLITALSSLISVCFTFLAGSSPILVLAYNILSIIILFIIVNPLSVGATKFFVEQAQGRPNMNNVFYSFRTDLSNIIKVSFLREVKLCIWLIVPEIIGFLITAAIIGIDEFVQNGVIGITAPDDVSVAAICFAYAVVVILMIPSIIKSIEYSIINFILADNPDMNSKEVFKYAKELMRGNKGRFFLLQLSFVGWYLLGVCAFGIGVLFLLPYISAANAQFYLDIKPKSEEKASEFVNVDNTEPFGL